ncbi:hypothetical protein CH302_27540 [Rhodococcus sp. 15-2388-1-1a]|uniref:glycoside hydrolase family 19 protein n=1 Tax=Rhodococcus sp. 15-2388-1-1a TaxID=2023142 RepID=UPI000B9AF1A8|nr:hypothetical protein [Rhodococcus sp. 15-2388-1-1a]OZE90208.1 hypothetical protein CH302_27540 [Rhodococcus sp. 15-2388-1-1a]
MVTAAAMHRAFDGVNSVGRYAALAPSFNEAMLLAGITNRNRAVMWFAQLGHESIGLSVFRELWDPTPDQRTYDGRMGNDQPGDGFRYRGRGAIQMTGKNNYRECSKWAHARGAVPTPTYFLDDPAAAERDEYLFLPAVWYWTTQRDLNGLSDRRDLVGATRAINGGTNGLADRQRRYALCDSMADALLPERITTMSYADDELTKKFTSRSKYRTTEDPIDTLAGFVLNTDARIHEEFVEREAAKGQQWAIDLVRREADKGDAGAKVALAKVGK